MRASLLICLFSFAICVYADQSQQQMMQQNYEQFVQTDRQIENLLKQKLQLKGQIAQHEQREDSSIRPRVDRRQNRQVQDLSQQLQTVNEQLSELEQQRSSLLLQLQ